DVYAGLKLVLHSRERRRLNQTACTLSKAGVPFASAAGTSFWAFACGVISLLWQVCAFTSGAEHKHPPTWVLTPSQNDRFPKTVKKSFKFNQQAYACVNSAGSGYPGVTC